MDEILRLLKIKEEKANDEMFNIRFFTDESCGVYEDRKLIKHFNNFKLLKEWLKTE